MNVGLCYDVVPLALGQNLWTLTPSHQISVAQKTPLHDNSDTTRHVSGQDE